MSEVSPADFLLCLISQVGHMSIPKPTASQGEWDYHAGLNQIMAHPLELEKDPPPLGMVYQKKEEKSLGPHKLGEKEGMAVGKRSVVSSLPIYLVLVT